VTKHGIDNLIDSFTVYLEINKNYAKGTGENYNHTIRESERIQPYAHQNEIESCVFAGLDME